MTGAVGAAQGSLRHEVRCVHDCTGGEFDVALLIDEDLAEVGLAEPVADLMKGDRFNVDVGDAVVGPRKARVVVNLSEGGIKLAVVVDIGESTGVGEDEGKRGAKDRPPRSRDRASQRAGHRRR